LGVEASGSAFEDFAEKQLAEDTFVNEGFSVGYRELTDWLDGGREFDDEKLSLIERHTPIRFWFLVNLGVQLKTEVLKAQLSSRDKNVAVRLASDPWCIGYVVGVSRKAFEFANMDKHGEVFDRGYVQSVLHAAFGEELLDKTIPLYENLVEARDAFLNEGMSTGIRDYERWTTEVGMGNMGLLSLPTRAAELYGLH